jgi:hypothetical protein
MLIRSLFTRSTGLLMATLGLALAMPASAIDFVHVIVLANGKQVEVKTMPEVKGNTAYFTTTSGQEFYIRASNIDAQKTQETNAEREKAAIIAQEIQTSSETPSNASLGALAEEEKKRRMIAGPSQVVTTRDLEKTSKTDLNSVERLPGAGLPDFTPAPTQPANSIPINITLPPQAAPAAPAPAGAPAPAEPANGGETPAPAPAPNPSNY